MQAQGDPRPLQQVVGVPPRTFAPDFPRRDSDRLGRALLADECRQQMGPGGRESYLGVGSNGWACVPDEAAGGGEVEGVKGAAARRG